MPLYSFSQIQKYLNCPLSYKFYYVDGKKPEWEENLHLILGTEVHSALEWLYNEINNFRKPTYKQLEQVFLNSFNKKSSKLDEELEKIEEFLTRGKYYLKSFYDKHYPFEDIKVVGTEVRLTIDLGDNIKFQGIIDRLDKKQDNFILTDYKTNKNLPPEDKTLYEEQLTLYGLGVKQKYGKYLNKIYGNLVYLHFEIQDFWEITEQRMQEISEKYKNIVLEIEQKKAEYNLGDEDAFPTTSDTSHCRFCDYKEICPLFAHQFGSIDDFELPDDMVRKLIDEYVQLNKQKKDIENTLNQNKEILIKFAKKNKLKKIYGNENNLSVVNYKGVKILNKDKLKEKLEKLGFLKDVLEVDRFKLKKMIDTGKITNTDLENIIDYTETLGLR